LRSFEGDVAASKHKMEEQIIKYHDEYRRKIEIMSFAG
jgi:hypothetical protein